MSSSSSRTQPHQRPTRFQGVGRSHCRQGFVSPAERRRIDGELRLYQRIVRSMRCRPFAEISLASGATGAERHFDEELRRLVPPASHLLELRRAEGAAGKRHQGS